MRFVIISDLYYDLLYQACPMPFMQLKSGTVTGWFVLGILLDANALIWLRNPPFLFSDREKISFFFGNVKKIY